MRTPIILIFLLMLMRPYNVHSQELSYTEYEFFGQRLDIRSLLQVPGADKLIAKFGDTGLMKLSTDLGETWPVEVTDVFYESVLFAIDDSTWFKERSGHLYKTTNSGNSWHQVHDAYCDGFFHAGTLIGSNYGKYAYFSYDLGQTWEYRVLPFTPRNFMFIDVNIGFSYGHNFENNKYYIFSTKDGGNTWTQSSESFPVLEVRTGLHFVDENNGVLFGSKSVPLKTAGDPTTKFVGTAFTTNDGGVTWHETVFPHTLPSKLRYIDGIYYLLSGNIGSSDNASYYSTDLGRTWKKWNIWNVADLIKIGDRYLCSTSLKLYQSDDDGKTWHTDSNLQADQVTYDDMEFYDENHGIIIGNYTSHDAFDGLHEEFSGFILFTSDGGKTWDMRENPGGMKLDWKDICYSDENTLYLLGSKPDNEFSSYILNSTNGGETWKLLDNYPFSGRVDGDAYFYPSGLGFMNLYDGSDGYILRYYQYNSSWKKLYKSDHPIGSLYCQNETTFYAGTYYKGILKSTDGGNNWRTSTVPLAHDISFVDMQTGVASIDRQHIYRTHDGGVSWEKVYTDNKSSTIENIRMFDSEYALAGCRDARIIRTVDGGESWHKVYNNYVHPSDFKCIGFPSRDTAILVSRYGEQLVLVEGLEDYPVAVEETAPEPFSLHQNYPNPFNANTTLTYSLPRNGRVSVTVYNTAGQKVITLCDEMHTAGTHQVLWNGLNERGTPVASGIYLYRLQTGSTVETRKMLFMK